MTYECNRCGRTTEKQVEQEMNYIRASDFAEPEPVEVHYGMMHTEETLKELDRLDERFVERDRQALSAEAANPEAPALVKHAAETELVEGEEGGEVETAKVEEVEFSIPAEKFDHVEIDSPNEVQDDDLLAYTYTLVEERDVQKTGLACPDCLKDDDEVIWGPDAE